MSVWDWMFGKGQHVPRPGPAHSSDRHGFWKDIWKLRRLMGIVPEHSGSVDIYDHFGCLPYNDNDVKRERRDDWRWVLRIVKQSTSNGELRYHCEKLLTAFEEADEAEGWRDS